MKKVLVIAAALTLFATPALAVIDGSAHDFVNGTNEATDSVAVGGTEDEICVFCHTPHNAEAVSLPLWNRDLPDSAGYTMYSSDTFDGDNSGALVPGAESLACLSCHDGSIAVDSYGGNVGTQKLSTDTTGYMGASAAFLDTDLSNDHPIGMTINTTADDELKDPTMAPLFGTGTDTVECASCHDVHDGAIGYFLVTSNAGSALCLDCHIK